MVPGSSQNTVRTAENTMTVVVKGVNPDATSAMLAPEWEDRQASPHTLASTLTEDGRPLKNSTWRRPLDGVVAFIDDQGFRSWGQDL